MSEITEIEMTLAVVASLEDALVIRRRIQELLAAAMKRLDLDASERLAVLRLRAERRAGEILIEMVKGGHLSDPEHKAEWIDEARRAFQPSKRKPCMICGRYGSLSQAHHIVPLHVQYDQGVRQADHRHVWLCPSHHAAVHLFISFRTGRKEMLGSTRIELIVDLGSEELRRALEIVWRMDS